MAVPGGIETKLDRYYDDLMEKILLLHELHARLLAENKEIKKELSKLRELGIHTQEDVDWIRTRMMQAPGHSLQHPSVSVSAVAHTSVTAPHASPLKTQENKVTNSPTKPASSAGQAPNSGPPPSGAAQNLKEFLASEPSIFDVKVLNAFIKATREVIKTNAKQDPQFLKIRIEKGMSFPIAIAGKLHLSHNGGKGVMALAFEASCIDAIAKAVFNMPQDAQVNEADRADVTSELCNQVCGKSKVFLSKDGYTFDIGMPVVEKGDSASLNKLLTPPKIALVFQLQEMPFFALFWG